MNIAQEWNSMDGERRREIVCSCRWVTRQGTISRLGQRIAQSMWGELSPAAQEVLQREVIGSEQGADRRGIDGNTVYLCCVCKKNNVDALAGFDTCTPCLKGI